MGKAVAALMLLGLLSACEPRSTPPLAQNANSSAYRPTSCPFLPPGFERSGDYLERTPVPITGYVKNVINVRRDGTLSWNQADLMGTQHGPFPILATYLDAVASIEPQPLTVLDFERGAPCATVEQVRAMMITRLQCSPQRPCLQGSAPFSATQ